MVSGERAPRRRLSLLTAAACGVGLIVITGLAGFRAPTPAAEGAPAPATHVNPTQVEPTERGFLIRSRESPKVFSVAGEGTISSEHAGPDGSATARLTLPRTGTRVSIRLEEPRLHVQPTEAPPRSISLPPRPVALAAETDGTHVWVACDSTATVRTVSRVDVMTGTLEQRPLPGTSNVRGVAVAPDESFVLVTHLLPKSNLPSTQIEQGWVFTNAVTIVPRSLTEPLITLPLDLRTQGFANPEGAAISSDGKTAWVAHSGADVVSVIDLEKARNLVSPVGPDGQPELDLTKTRRYVRARIPVGSMPMGVALSSDGRVLAVANRLSDSVSLIDVATSKVTKTIPLASLPDDAPRRGERLFFSGKLSLSGQFSCGSCHPDGQADGLNWDLPADGFNNFQNTKSLVGIDGTSPYGWLGTTDSLSDRFQGTLQHLFQHDPTPAEVADISAYLSETLKHRPKEGFGSPPDLTVFRKAGCSECHTGDRFTDRQMHDVLDSGRPYDTPSLIGVGQTAPYLHDGRATKLEDVFQKHNAASLHGRPGDLTADEFQQLMDLLRRL